MLSISTLHAVDYYTHDSNEAFAYYGEASNKAETDPAGRWAGALANRYFPAGQVVTPEHFAALFFGFDPITGVALTKSADQLGFDLWKAEQAVQKPELNEEAAKEARTRVQKLRSQLLQRERSGEHRHHRAGIDLTFSAPKDFSLLVAAASPEERKRLLAAWGSAVEATLKTAEERYAKTRMRVGNGQLIKEGIAGSAIAMFEHIAARPVGNLAPDPDVHLHCVMFSPVLCHDDETRALFSNDLRLNLKVLDAEARARLAQSLTQMGYGLTEDRQKNCTSFHLAGVRADERERFSKRRGEILDGIKSGEYQATHVAAIGTRQGKGDWTRADALNAWHKAFAQIGLTYQRLKSAKPEHEVRGSTDQEIIDHLLAMKSYFTPRELREVLWGEAQFSKVPDGLEIGSWIDERANQILKSPDLLQAQLPDGSSASRQRTAVGDDEPVFTTRSLLIREIALDDAVSGLGLAQTHSISAETARPIIEALEYRKTEAAKREAISKATPLPDGFQWKYRDDQLAAIFKILNGPNIGFIQAFAGTGKTTTAAAMIDVYRANGREVIALAPSNKAAGQLSEDCALEGSDSAKTIDSFLLGKAKDRVSSNTVIFVDEASMLSFDHAEALVKLVRERGAKIIFQGDSRQLPSVQRGRFFANCIEKRLGSEAAELTVITRQRADWSKAATEAAARGDFAETMILLDEHGAVHTEGTDKCVLERIAADHLADPQPANQKLIVASRNSDVAVLNQKIRCELVAKGQVAEGIACQVGKESKQRILVGVGDRIIFTDTLKQDGRKLAANGALGSVQSVTATENGIRIRVLLDGQRLPIEFNAAEFAGFQHGYACSIHKSQGATLESCRYLFSEFVSSELAYVAMSRHRSTFGLYCREDQKQDLSRWMGKGIEKLDARDLVSSEALNQEAATLHRHLADQGAATRNLISRLNPLLKFAANKISGFLPRELHFDGMAKLSMCLDRLIDHRKKLATKLRKPQVPAPVIKPQEQPSLHLKPTAQEIRRPRFH